MEGQPVMIMIRQMHEDYNLDVVLTGPIVSWPRPNFFAQLLNNPTPSPSTGRGEAGLLRRLSFITPTKGR